MSGMQRRLALLALLVPACASNSGAITGGLTTGAITTPLREDHAVPVGTTGMSTIERDRVHGVEFRGFAAGAIKDVAFPNAYGFAVRQLGAGNGVQTSLQAGWMITRPVGRAMVFGRLMFDLMSWTRIGGDTTLSALSPTFDVGIAPFGHGVCVSASGTWDVRFNDPDRGLIGAFIGLCGGGLKY